MGAPSSVSIPHDVAPGEEVDIHVPMVAPSDNGSYQGNWRMRNTQGVFFGDEVWIAIEVVGEGGGNHLTRFLLDPPSPSAAETVRIDLRVEGFPNFRAMRIKIDGQEVYQLGAPEFVYEWDTADYADGDHLIMVEIADATDTGWNYPERHSAVYTLQGPRGGENHAPHRPSLVSPYDWYVYYSGGPTLCAQENGDPDGDPVPEYFFEIYESAQNWQSGWTTSNCVSPSGLGPYNYQWHVKVRDNRGAESDWSDPWHFTIVNPDLIITELYFEPLDPQSEEVRIMSCTDGQGGIGITMRVSVNDASDGSDSGEWHIIKELGVPCFNQNDAPVWETLPYGDGPHLVRVLAHGLQTGWDGAAVRDEIYTLPHRRPASPLLVAPVPLSGENGETVWLNYRTVPFRWAPTLRATSYTLHISTNPMPMDDPSPIFRQTFDAGVTAYTYTLDQDYPTLYWQVSADNDMGTTGSPVQVMGIDRIAPTCAVQPLPETTYETVFAVYWGGSDDRSGIRTYDVQYREPDRTDWTPWLLGIPVTTTYELFTGQAGHTYEFRCRATDVATNMGSYPDTADTFTTVDPTARPPEPWWDAAYALKRNIVVLNNMGSEPIPVGYPVYIHFDENTIPTAAEIYDASQSAPKCNDLRVVYNNATELDRVVRACSSTTIDMWFRSQVSIPGGSADNTSHQLYYGNPSAGTPPGSPTTVFDPPLDANTVGLWYMHEGSGSTLYDSSGYNNNCSIDATTTWVPPGKFSGALHFLGETHGPTVNCGAPSTFDLQTFTYEMYVRRTGSSPWGRLAGHLGNEQNRWLLSFEPGFSGRIRVTIWPCPTCGAEDFTSQTALTDMNWHHVAFTLESSTIKIYIDGQLDYTGHVNGGNIRQGTPPFTIGSAEDIERAYAEVAHVAFSNIARTSFPYAGITAITNEPTVAAGDIVLPPVGGTAELVLQGVAVDPTGIGGAPTVWAVIENQGTLATQNGFFVDLYADHQPTGPGDLTGSVRYWVASPIEAGATITVVAPLSEITGTHDIYIQADSTGVISETDDQDNISTAVQVCAVSADSYEDDGTPALATGLLLGAPQSHNFHAAGDQDWLKFTAAAGEQYIISTGDLGSAADTYLYLYDVDGATLLAANDDYSGTLASRLVWTAPTEGDYYLLVQPWNPSAGGCETGYTVNLAICDALQGVQAQGPAYLAVGETGLYSATYFPITATAPVILTWDNGTVGPVAAYSWAVTGTYTVTVTGASCCGTVTTSRSVQVGTTATTAYRAFLPAVSRNYAPPVRLAVYSDAADGEVLNVNCSAWDTCRNASSGNASWQGLDFGSVGATYNSWGFTIQRLFLYFDTSAIPPDAQILSATLHLYVGGYQNGHQRIHVVPSYADIPPGQADFGRVQFASGGTADSFPANSWLEIDLSEAAQGWIQRGDWTRLALIHDLDLFGIMPSATNDTVIALAENTAYRPFLVVVYAEGTYP